MNEFRANGLSVRYLSEYPSVRSNAGFTRMKCPLSFAIAIKSSERPKNRSMSLRASARSCADRFCSVMSRAIVDAPTTRPLESRTAEIVSDTSMSEPFLRRRVVSKRSTRSPAATRASSFATSSSWPSGTSSAIDWPVISASEYPYSRSAPGFQLTIVPSVVLLMIASAQDSTTAARWPARPSNRVRSLTSRIALEISVRPSVSNGLSEASTGNSVPSLRRPRNSRPDPIPRGCGSDA